MTGPDIHRNPNQINPVDRFTHNIQCDHWPRYTNFSSVYRKSLKLGGEKQLSPLGTKRGYKTDENGWILSSSGEILWWNS